MEYKGIEYAVRARPGPHQWVWTILPKGEAALMSQFVGSKERASADACRGIDRWLERQRIKRGRPSEVSLARKNDGDLPDCARWTWIGGAYLSYRPQNAALTKLRTLLM